MPNDRKQSVGSRRNPLGSGECGVPAALGASTPPGRLRLDRRAEAPEPPAIKWRGRTLVLGCLAWFLILLGLLALLEHLAARRSPETVGLPERHAPAAGAPPEGASRHQ